MLSLLNAEMQKINGNRWLVGFTLWIFPIGALTIFAFATLILVLGADRGTMGLDNLRWTDQMLLSLALPTNLFGQVFLMGFCATVFANESSLNMWKNIIPRNRRMHFIVVKFLAIALMILIALTLTAIVTAVGSMILSLAGGSPITPSLQDANLGEFFKNFLLSALMALASTFVYAGYAMLASLLTRSNFAGIVVGVGFILLDQILPVLLMLISRVTQLPSLVLLHQLTPSYNINNAGQWILNQQGFTYWAEWANGVPNTLLQSVGLVVVWFVGLMSVSIWIFNRRDVA